MKRANFTNNLIYDIEIGAPIRYNSTAGKTSGKGLDKTAPLSGMSRFCLVNGPFSLKTRTIKKNENKG